MKKIMLMLLIAFTAMSITACKSSKNTSNNDDVDSLQTEQHEIDDEEAMTNENNVDNENYEEVGDDGNNGDGAQDKKLSRETVYRVIVTFFSIGEGTSEKGLNDLQNFIAFQNENTEKTLARDTVPWGREGEVDFCFKLDELIEQEQINFVEGLKETFAENELVRIEENTICRHIR